MNQKILLLLALAGTCSGTLRAADALQDIQPLNLSGFNFAESGFSFRPTTNLTVTRLGYFFKPSANPASYVVRLLDSNGVEIRAVTNSAPAAATNQLVYTDITQVVIAAGATNSLQAYDLLYAQANSNAKLWDGYVIDSRDANSGSFSVAPQIEYLGAVTNGLPYAGTNAPSFLLAGPNLFFPISADVVPSTLTITLISSNSVRVSWPVTDTLGVLQSAPALAGVWTNVVASITTNAPNKVVDLPVVPPGAFFRLNYPSN